MKKIFFTVTNDLSYDQRMNRICSSLADHGFSVHLVGRKLPQSLPLRQKPYQQYRLNCIFKKGKLFYAEYNTRLFFFLLTKRMDAVCAIDLDTILPCYFISKAKNIPRIYDAHELFTELKEVVTRPQVKNIWTRIEKFAVPKFRLGYTVCQSISNEFKNRYGVDYQTIRNLPVLQSEPVNVEKESFLLYQGAVNEARGLEFLVPAMKTIPCKLVICGDGNFMSTLKELIQEHGVQDKIELKGMLLPEELKMYTNKALIGISILENTGLNQYFSLQNKFFDYINAGLPQVSMNFPEYKKINDAFEVAALIDDLDISTISETINDLLKDKIKYNRLQANCSKAREELNWNKEQHKLIEFYNTHLK